MASRERVEGQQDSRLGRPPCWSAAVRVVGDGRDHGASGVNAWPVLALAAGSDRIRFFFCSEHTDEQIDRLVLLDTYRATGRKAPGALT